MSSSISPNAKGSPVPSEEGTNNNHSGVEGILKRGRDDSLLQRAGKRVKTEQDPCIWHRHFEEACKDGDLEGVLHSVSQTKDFEHRKGWDSQAAYTIGLEVAAAEGHEKIVDLLFDRGAEINHSIMKSGPALCAAARNGHLDVLETLIHKGANIHAKSSFNPADALQLACFNGHVDIVKRLLRCGAKIEDAGWHGTPLCAASRRGHNRVVQILLRNKARVHTMGSQSSALYLAAGEGHAEVVNTLILHKAKVNAKEGYYGSALQYASVNDCIDAAEELLAGGARVNQKGGHHGSALGAACALGHKGMVKLLLDNGATYDIQTTMQAHHAYDDEIVEMICSKSGFVDLDAMIRHHEKSRVC
jgi:ankyrin repeat protein